VSLAGGGRPPDSAIPTHLDVLGQLHVWLGAFAGLAGVSLVILAAGTSLALSQLGDTSDGGQAGVWILFWCGVTMAGGGMALALTGRALARRRPAGRRWALVLAVPDLLAVPFGTALSIYAFWVLLNDEARREFGRPPRLPHPDDARGPA
jgi:hypothetical protein